MPELPEVETLKLGLQKYLVGHKIEGIEVRVAKILQGDTKNVIGQKVTGIQRVGKGLIIELDGNYDLVVHLKMTGQMVYRDGSTANLTLSPKVGGNTLPSKYSHVIFTLDKGAKLYFNDLRRFGYIKVIKKEEVKNLSFFKEMGPEPFKDLTPQLFENLLKRSSVAIKVFLMDQKRIGGVGNIYANEALFMAGIDPRHPADNLSKEKVQKLYESILEVLEKGLKYGGSSDENFVNVLGQDGAYQQHFLAYGREKQKCSICGGTVHKIQLGGRGTYFCPNHQR